MAFGASTFSDFGGAVSNLFSSEAYKTKAQGNRLQAQEYGLAAQLARQNEQFAKTSTEIKEAQADREIYKTIGGQQAQVASAGFAASGSAIDLLRESASQGALTKAVLGQQGLIEEAGYEEQAKSYDIMQQSANLAAEAEDKASQGAWWSGIIKGVAGVASMVDPTGISSVIASIVGPNAENHDPGLDS